MIPVVDNNHVGEGQLLLTDRYKSTKVVTGMVKSCMQRFQEIEDSYWELIGAVQLANHPMPGGPWDVLDKIGFIVGAPARNGLSDADYLALLRLQIQVNRSRGTPEDVIALGQAMGRPVGYLEMPPAAFYLWVFNIAPSFALFPNLLNQVRAAATYGMFIYTTHAPGNDLIWSSRYDPTAGQGTWGSRYDASVGGTLSAALVM
jgi:hypothetical protein